LQPAPSWGAGCASLWAASGGARSAGLCGSATWRHPPAAPVLPLKPLASRPIRLRAAGFGVFRRVPGQQGHRSRSVCRLSVSTQPKVDTDLLIGRCQRLQSLAAPRKLPRDRCRRVPPTPLAAQSTWRSTCDPRCEGIPAEYERLVPGGSSAPRGQPAISPHPEGLREDPAGIPSLSSPQINLGPPKRPSSGARRCSETTSGRRDDRHLAVAAPSKERGPGDGCGSRSSAECSQRARARTRRAWRSRSSGRRRRSDVSLAFACNRTCVPKIGQPSDDSVDLQRGLQQSQKSPANRRFWI
jgi:hypothetical protein